MKLINLLKRDFKIGMDMYRKTCRTIPEPELDEINNIIMAHAGKRPWTREPRNYENMILNHIWPKITDRNDAPLILDAGCGAGYLAYRLSRVADMECIDLSQACISHCLRQQKIHETDILFELGNATDIKQPDNRYDFVILAEVLEHVIHPADVLNELHRVLKPGGYLYLSTPYQNRAETKAHINYFFKAGEEPKALPDFKVYCINYLISNCGFTIEYLVHRGRFVIVARG